MIFFFFSDIDGVLKSANGTEYGLASGVFTKDLSKVWFIFFQKASIFFFSYFTTHSLQRKTYIGSSSNVHSRKWTAVLTAAFTTPHFSQLPYKLCISTFS